MILSTIIPPLKHIILMISFPWISRSVNDRKENVKSLFNDVIIYLYGFFGDHKELYEYC